MTIRDLHNLVGRRILFGPMAKFRPVQGSFGSRRNYAPPLMAHSMEQSKWKRKP
jgi:hypothetical protein